MPYYSTLGQIPPKRHIQFRRPDGALYSDEDGVGADDGWAAPARPTTSRGQATWG